MKCQVCDGAGEVFVSATCKHGWGSCPECGGWYRHCSACDDGHAFCNWKGCYNRAVELVVDEALCTSHATQVRRAA